MASKDIICAMCGFKNQGSPARCASCGAKLDEHVGVELTEEEEHARRHQQESFEWKWVFVAFSIHMVLQAIILVALPIVITAYDPQGTPGMLISAAVWFVGGIITGVISPGKTFVEPAVGAFLAAAPTVAWLMHIDHLYQIPMPLYIVGGLIGVMITLFGAFLGEKIQMGTRGHAKAR